MRKWINDDPGLTVSDGIFLISESALDVDIILMAEAPGCLGVRCQGENILLHFIPTSSSHIFLAWQIIESYFSAAMIFRYVMWDEMVERKN